MERYDIDASGNDVIVSKDKYGDWVKYDDANNEIYNLKIEIGKLTGALQDIYDVAYRVL